MRRRAVVGIGNRERRQQDSGKCFFEISLCSEIWIVFAAFENILKKRKSRVPSSCVNHRQGVNRNPWVTPLMVPKPTIWPDLFMADA
jgi:hypothetical protein